MFSLIYRSVARESFIESDIYKMLSDARDFNAEHHITGCLLYHDRKFLQLLEGEKSVIISLFNAIESDSMALNRLIITDFSPSKNWRNFLSW